MNPLAVLKIIQKFDFKTAIRIKFAFKLNPNTDMLYSVYMSISTS